MTNIFHNRSAKYVQSKNFLTRSSRYVGALASFVEDTKPYHSKLTDVVEEYQFSDTLTVKLTETTKTLSRLNSTWLYNYFSSGDIAPTLSLPAKALHTPFSKNWALAHDQTLPTVSGYVVGQDELTELTAVPYVYSKQTYNGVAEVAVKRVGSPNVVEPLYEGLDYFRSQGAFQFKVRQTDDANQHFIPQWVDVRKDGIIAESSEIARLRGNDTTSASSAISKVKALLTSIANLPISAEASALLTSLLTTINAAPSASDYVSLRSQLITDGLVVPDIIGYDLIEWTRARADQLSTASLTAYSTLFHRLVDVDATGASFLPWSNVSGDPAFPFYRSNYEPLLRQLIADDTPPPAGYIGWIGETQQYVSDAFASFSPPYYFNAYGEFDIREPGQPAYAAVSNAYVSITNINVSTTANPADQWYVVAENPAAAFYTVFSATYGYIGAIVPTSNGAQFDSAQISFTITLLASAPVGETLFIRNSNRVVFDSSAPLETWSIIKTTPMTYSRPALSSTRYGYLSDLSLTGQLLETGYLVLTARADGITFDVIHDRMPTLAATVSIGAVVSISNQLSFKINAGSEYQFREGDRFFIHIRNDPAKAENLDLGFGYDLDSFDNQDEHYGADALNFAYSTRFADYDFGQFNLQIAQNAVGGRSWRVTAIPDLTRPVPAETPISATPIPVELQLYYASEFDVRYSDDGFVTSTSVGSIPIGTSFDNSTQGISFTLALGTKPFIGVVSGDVIGGDVFSFYVSNPAVVLDELPVSLSSIHAARLMPLGEGFYETPAATWTVTFASSTAFVLQNSLGASASGTLATTGLLATEGYSVSELGVQFVIRPGVIGLAAGDSFSFRTYERKPSYLVYGSSSGWQDDVVVGEPYWNGKVGFTIEEPRATLFSAERLEQTSPNTWPVGNGAIVLSRLRFDAPNRIYSLTPVVQSGVNIGWMVHASDRGIVGRLPREGVFSDAHITLTSAAASADVIPLRLVITASDFEAWAAQDAVILRSTASARLPRAGDELLIDGRLDETLGVSLNYELSVTKPSITGLAPVAIDPHYIDTSTEFGKVALSTTSPETKILSSWIPLSLSRLDSTTSTASFPDVQSIIEVRSASNGEPIGTLEGSTFTWASTFISDYLPLNAEANVVIYNTGTTDRVRANISETLNIFVGAGLTTTDFLLHDSLAISLSENDGTYLDSNTGHSRPNLQISIIQTEAVASVVGDAQTGRFIAGYGNLPYDLEDGINGYFDVGVPLTNTFTDAKYLSSLSSLTTAETAKLRGALAGLNGFLINNDIHQTELPDFLGLVEGYVSAHAIELAGTNTGFGYPESGIAFGSTMRDSLLVVARNTSSNLYTAILHSNTLPIGQTVPNPLNIAPTTTYEGFSTPLTITSPANVVQIRFLWTESNYADFISMPTPQVWAWLPGEVAPVQLTASRVLIHEAAPVDYTLHEAAWAIEVTLPSLTEAKIYLVPGL